MSRAYIYLFERADAHRRQSKSYSKCYALFSHCVVVLVRDRIIFSVASLKRRYPTSARARTFILLIERRFTSYFIHTVPRAVDGWAGEAKNARCKLRRNLRRAIFFPRCWLFFYFSGSPKRTAAGRGLCGRHQHFVARHN